MDEGTVFGMRSWSMVPTLSSRPRSFFKSMFEALGPGLRNTGLLCVLQNSTVLLFTFTASARLELVVCPWLILVFCSLETHCAPLSLWCELGQGHLLQICAGPSAPAHSNTFHFCISFSWCLLFVEVLQFSCFPSKSSWLFAFSYEFLDKTESLARSLMGLDYIIWRIVGNGISRFCLPPQETPYAIVC